MTDLAEPRRQSQLAVVFLAIRLVRRLGFAQLAIIVLFIVRAPFGLSVAALIVLGIVALAGLSVLAWWRFTFCLVDGEVVVQRGIFSTERLSLPVERIQSMSLEQELLHRVTGLVKVSIDTAGSSESELTIDALERPVAEELQREVLAERAASPVASEMSGMPTGTAPDDEERVVFAHTPRRLLLTALTGWPLAGLAVLGSLFAAISVVGIEPEDSLVDVDPEGFRWWWVPLGLVALLGISVMLNMIRVLTQDWDLTVRTGDRSVRRTSGLISLTSRASSIDRVQVVTTSQNPLQHAFGLRQVDLASIGSGDLQVAGCDDGEVETLRRLVDADVGPLDLARRVHPAVIWLTTRNTALIAALVGGVLAFSVGWWALLALVAPIVAGIASWRHVRTHRWDVGERLAARSHVIDRSTEEALLRKANAVIVTQSLFERRRGLASVEMATGAGSIEIGMIPHADAEALRDLVVHAAETDHRRWM